MKLFQKWKLFAEKVASFQANIILSIVYLLIILPTGIIMKLFFKKIWEIEPDNNSYWKKRIIHQSSLKLSQKQ